MDLGCGWFSADLGWLGKGGFLVSGRSRLWLSVVACGFRSRQGVDLGLVVVVGVAGSCVVGSGFVVFEEEEGIKMRSVAPLFMSLISITCHDAENCLASRHSVL